MKKTIYLSIPLILSVLFLWGCKDSGTVQQPKFTIETVTETLNNEDVFFIFTNTSMTDNAPVSPSVSSSLEKSRSAAGVSYFPPFSIDSIESETGIMSEVREFNRDGFVLTKDVSRNVVIPDSPSLTIRAANDDDGDGDGDGGIDNDNTTPSTELFYTGLTDKDGSVQATCRYISDTLIHNIKLSIWVEDAEWTDGVTSGKINQDMVNIMADKFLISNDNNDIYEWVSDIYGVPWGDDPNQYINLIDSAESASITILLSDIKNADSTDGGTVGYFYSKDNFLSSYYSGSNERIMFYIDSAIYAKAGENSDSGNDAVWKTSDYWPQVIFSTLAHEFQHMIHFYQKQIMFNTSGTDIWLNEMCSLVTEDLIAEKINNIGPRGVLAVDTAGNSENDDGRLPIFNVAHNNTFLKWEGGLDDYSTAYAFGAFLARNYGGAELFQKIVQSSETDEHAVLNAINSINSIKNLSKTFEDLLIEWGKAVLNSDLTDTTYQYNKNDAFSSSVDGNNYNLGSINLNNYHYLIDDIWYLDGPFIYNKIYDGNKYYSISSAILEPGTNAYYQAGRGLTGTYSWAVELPEGVTLTVVRK